LGTCPAGPRPHKATRGPSLFDPHKSIDHFLHPTPHGLLRVPSTPSHTEGVCRWRDRAGEGLKRTARQHANTPTPVVEIKRPHPPPCPPVTRHQVQSTSGMCPHPKHATHTVTQWPRAAKRLPASQEPWTGLGKEATGCSTLGQCHAASARTPPRSPRRRAPSCSPVSGGVAERKLKKRVSKMSHKFEPSKNLT
jgi:hypothetical protein